MAKTYLFLTCILAVLLREIVALQLWQCSSDRSTEQWELLQDKTIKLKSDHNRCVTAVVLKAHYGQHLEKGNVVALTECVNDSSSFLQSWTYNSSVLTLSPTVNTKLVLRPGGNGQGSKISVEERDIHCGTQCQWNVTSDGRLVNMASRLCLDAPPSAPRTCDPASPSHSFPFCNTSLLWNQRINDLSRRLSLEEKIAQMIGPFVPPILQLNIGGFWWDQTCIHGIADDYDMGRYSMQTLLASYVTIFPHAIAQAASFNVPLSRRMAKATADEARALNRRRYEMGYSDEQSWCLICNGGPLANLVHDPRWGRTSETYGEDPYVISRFAAEYTAALQNSLNSKKYIQTVSVIRHYLAFSGPDNEGTFSAEIGLRDLEDSILPGFQASVLDGKALGMMCDYGAINGTPGCANQHAMQEVLRSMWGYEGYVTDDWGAVNGVYGRHHFVNSTAAAVATSFNAGVNILYNDESRSADILADINNKALSQFVVEDNFKLLFTMRMKLGEFDPINENPYAQIPYSVVDSEEHRKLARQAAQESIVLLHNVNGTLPFCIPGSEVVTKLCSITETRYNKIAVIGPTANASVEQYTHSYAGLPSYVIRPLDGITQTAHEISQGKVSVQFQQGCDINSNSSDGIQAAVDIAKMSDVIVYIGGLSAAVSREGIDRSDVKLPGVQPEIVSMLASIGKPMVVCLVNGAPLSFNLTNIGGVIETWYGGQEAGSALADVLFGRYNPGGKLPLTFFDQSETLPSMTSYDFTASPGRTYRYYSGKPQWSFGYGLSYSTFRYNNVKAARSSSITACSNVTVSVSVTNTGTVDGDEVVQLYVTVPAQAVPVPRHSLQGFQRLHVEQGKTETATFELTPYQLSYADANGQRRVARGNYSLWIGGHLPSDQHAPGNVLRLNVEVQGQAASIDGRRRCKLVNG